MTDSDSAPALHALAQAAARTSDAAAEWPASLAALGRSIRVSHAAGVSIRAIGRELQQGRTQAKGRRARALLRPSVLLRQHIAEVVAAAAASGLTDVVVFGSCARGTDTPASDVDLLVDTGRSTSLIDISAFAIAVADILEVDEERVDVVTGGLVPGSRLDRQIAAEAQPLAAWSADRRRLDSLPGWIHASDAGASEDELIEVAESGLHPWGGTSAALRGRPAGRPAGATLVDFNELARVSGVVAAYATGINAGLGHGAALTRAVTRD